MAAINGVRKSSVVKKQKGKVGIIVPIITAIISILLVVLGFILFWKYYYQDEFTNSIVTQMESGKYQAYHAIRDISAGEYIDGAVELVAIPNSVTSSDLLLSGDDISNLKASIAIPANALISDHNVYDPELQTPVLESTRIYTIDYLSTPGCDTGDYIDIRLKTNAKDDASSLVDTIVCSKIEILDKNESGKIQIRLSESDILNLNSAVIEAGASGRDREGQLYVGKYVDPANQVKATITYSGAGIEYTEEELLEAQQVLRDRMNGVTSDNTDDTQGTQDTQDTQGTQADSSVSVEN